MRLILHPARLSQPKHLACVIGRRHSERQELENLAHPRHLIGVAARQLAFAEVEIILKADADICPKDSTHRAKLKLVATRRQDRPMIVAAKQPIGHLANVGDIPRINANAPAEAEYGLNDQRRRQQSSLGKIGDIVKMADVVTFAFKARSVAADLLNDALDHLFGIDVNATLGAVEQLDLPIVLPISISIDDLLAPIGGNRSHIEGGQLGLEAHSRGYALINRRPGAATRGDVDDGIGRAPDLADELAINLR